MEKNEEMGQLPHLYGYWNASKWKQVSPFSVTRIQEQGYAKETCSFAFFYRKRPIMLIIYLICSLEGHMTYCARLIPKLCGRPGNEANIVFTHMT